MTETYKHFKPLDDIFLLTEHTAKTAFAASAMNASESESALHKLLHGNTTRAAPHQHVNLTFGTPSDRSV